MNAIVVEVRRNGVVEAVHRLHAVAVRDGTVIAEAGDAQLTCFLRSSSKPLQALPLARGRDDLDDRDLAIASASHRATDDQLAAVRALLAKAPATADELELGPPDGPPAERILHNCSGKHAGMLALCRANAWDANGYRLAGHPVQEACRAAHSEAAEVDADELVTGIDGCGVLTPRCRSSGWRTRSRFEPARGRRRRRMRGARRRPRGADLHLIPAPVSS